MGTTDTLDTAPVLAAVREAISKYGKPEIINSDQGSQLTNDKYTEHLKTSNIRQSMDGKTRWVDNVIIERWFSSTLASLTVKPLTSLEFIPISKVYQIRSFLKLLSDLSFC